MIQKDKPWLISVVGPTAVGKTALAIKLAIRLKCHILSADSRQFYREMTIGTAKPTPEELEQAPHHFIDSHSISEHYSAGAFGRDALIKIEELHQKSQVIVAVGGSGLYLNALWNGFDEMPAVPSTIREELNLEYKKSGLDPLLKELDAKDPMYYKEVDRQNHQRVIRALEVIRGTDVPFSEYRVKKKVEMPFNQLKLGLNMERAALFDKINLRMDQMIASGLFEEAQQLYTHKTHNALRTVGYTEIFDFMDHLYDKEEAIRLLKRNSRRYAKRQLTWFRKFHEIHWFDPKQEREIMLLVDQTIN